MKRSRLSLEERLQEIREALTNEQTLQMQRLELMERVAVAVSDLLSARHIELSPIELTIFSRLGGVSDIRLSADSQGQISTWPSIDDDDIPF
jgi:hypothetical protein